MEKANTLKKMVQFKKESSNPISNMDKVYSLKKTRKMKPKNNAGTSFQDRKKAKA